MLDAALFVAIQPPFPPPTPEIVEERQWLSPKAEIARRNSERLVSGYEGAVGKWREQLRSLRASAEATMPSTLLTPQEREQVDRLIEDVEQHAEDRAVMKARFEKRTKRDAKRYFDRDPSMGAVMRSFAERLLRTDTEAIEEWLDHALWLRAFRAKRIAESRGGRMFDDPDALKAYLEAALG